MNSDWLCFSNHDLYVYIKEIINTKNVTIDTRLAYCD